MTDNSSDETHNGPPPGSLRELVQVALPLVISSGSASLMYVIDRVFLKRYSTEAMAAALPASMLHWTLISLAIGTVSYVNAFVAQYYGARQFERVGAIVWQGIYFSLLAGFLLLVSFRWPTGCSSSSAMPRNFGNWKPNSSRCSHWAPFRCSCKIRFPASIADGARRA